MKLEKHYIFYISITQSPKKFTTNKSSHYNNIIVIRDPKQNYFDFDWPKDGGKNLTHEMKHKNQLIFR